MLVEIIVAVLHIVSKTHVGETKILVNGSPTVSKVLCGSVSKTDPRKVNSSVAQMCSLAKP